jgi:hypothetical protein
MVSRGERSIRSGRGSPAGPQCSQRRKPAALRKVAINVTEGLLTVRRANGGSRLRVPHNAWVPCGLKNALEAGRQSSHTTVSPVSHSSTGAIRPNTTAPAAEWITEYMWPPTSK